MMKQLQEELQNSNIINIIRNFNDALINDWETDKKDCIYILNLLELKKVLQDYCRKIKKDMHLSNKNNLKKDKNI